MSARRLLGQTGDTIVEVMIVVTILGFIVAGVYSIASGSLRSARQAQERSEALKYTEGQLEQLKHLANTNGNAVFGVAGTFCIDGSSQAVSIPGSLPPFEEDDFANYPVGCIKDNRYHMAIQRTGNNQFAVTARWDRLGGGRDQITMLYRMYQ